MVNAHRTTFFQTCITALVAFALLFMLIIGFSAAQDVTPTFRIGVIDDPYGSISTGVILAAERINNTGGVQGADGTIFNLEVVITPPDSEGDIELAVENLRQASLTAVIGPRTTEQVLDNMNLLQSIGTPVITPAIGDTILASDTLDVLLRSRASEALYGRALAQVLINDLQVDNVAVVQLDIASTAGVVGFTTAASSLNVGAQRSFLFRSGMELSELVEDIVEANAQATVIYGPPQVSGELFVALREADYSGLVGYNLAASEAFKNVVPVDFRAGVIAANNWSVGLNEPESIEFLVEYVRMFGAVPDAVSAASYDSVLLIAEALRLPGELTPNLLNLEGIFGAQGELNPRNLNDGETSDNVVVSIVNQYGGEDVIARFQGNTRIIPDDFVIEERTPTPVVSPTPTASPTLDGVYVRVVSNVLNVRSGPSTNYDILGQLREGEVVPLLGANIDFTWGVIEFRLQQGWISLQPNLVEVLGDRRSLPVVAAPATPTPAPPTETAVPSDIADITVTDVTPRDIPFNTSATVNVTLRNIGGRDAGPFAVATSFEPNNVYAAQNLNGLAAGASTTIQLTIPAINQTGNYEAIIIADLNNEINEGVAGEANNRFSYLYKVDRPSLTNTTTLGVGASLDIDGGGADIVFSTSGLDTVGGCVPPVSCIGLLSPAMSWETAHYDAITPANGVNTNSIFNVSLAPGTTIGVLTNQGNRAVIRIDSITPGNAVTFTYRFY